MAVLSLHHKELTNGVGKCSVPMWCQGVPAGFCDKPAYGNQLPKSRYDGYVPALACPIHGGPDKPESVAEPMLTTWVAVEKDTEAELVEANNTIRTLSEAVIYEKKERDKLSKELEECTQRLQDARSVIKSLIKVDDHYRQSNAYFGYMDKESKA